MADLICGTEPVIDMTPFRADRPSLHAGRSRERVVAMETAVDRRIAFINPFGTAAFDAIIEETLVPYAGARHARSTSSTSRACPANIDYYYPKHLMELAIFDEVRRLEERGYDAVVVGCCYDPGVRVARELVDIPVVGPLEAAMNHASYFGHSFTVVTDHAKARPWLEDLVRHPRRGQLPRRALHRLVRHRHDRGHDRRRRRRRGRLPHRRSRRTRPRSSSSAARSSAAVSSARS